jgi:lipopolysaccharide biosynthesis protein
MADTPERLIVCYLPQYHPIPENDQWWGKSFTEWTNVTKSRPLFRDHYQPHLPADLGFYDLRVPEVREAQATLAREYGIHGFCYHHYWFHGSRLLHRPFEEVLASGRPDFSSCLWWANESWNRAWEGWRRSHPPWERYIWRTELNDVVSRNRLIRCCG